MESLKMIVQRVLSLLVVTGMLGWGACGGDYADEDETEGLQLALSTDPTSWAGLDSCAWGSTACSRCVDNVIPTFRGIGDRDGHEYVFVEENEPTHHLVRGGRDVKIDLNDHEHIQGCGRLPIRGPLTFVCTFNQVNHTGGFFVAEVPSRPSDGGPITDTRLAHGPYPGDRVVAYYLLENFPTNRRLNHLGGMSMIGKYMFVAAECQDNCPDNGAEVFVFDMSYPRWPQLVSSKRISKDGGLGSVAATRLSTGQYMFMAGMKFYVSSSRTMPRGVFEGLDGRVWERKNLDVNLHDGGTGDSKGWNSGWNARPYQNVEFVVECGTRHLYLTGSHKDHAWNGDDWYDLWQVIPRSSHVIRLSKRVKQKAENRKCEFQGSGNPYVLPDGRLAFYCASKYDSFDRGIAFEQLPPRGWRK